MKARGAAVQGALAVGALVAAWATWKRPPEQAQGEVVVVGAAKGQLEKIRYDDGLRWLELTREQGGEGPAWVKTGGFEQRAVLPDAGHSPAQVVAAGASRDAGVLSKDAGLALASAGTQDAGAAFPPVPQMEKVALPTREVRGSERAEKAFERFAPLRAARALGKLPEDKRKEIGLANTSRRLEVTTGGATHAFRVSAASFGVGSPYLESERDGQVYLLQGTVLSELEPAAQMLVERRLHAFKPTEFDELTLKSGGKQKTFVQKLGDELQQPKLAPKEAPEKLDELARNWHEKVWNQLWVSEVYGKGERPPAGEPQLQVRLEYQRRGEPKGWLELATVAAPGKEANAATPTQQVFARSENTAGWVLLHAGAEPIVAEAAKVLSGSGS